MSPVTYRRFISAALLRRTYSIQAESKAHLEDALVVPVKKLNENVRIPILGLGTWQGHPKNASKVYEAVLAAIDIGYRHFDCAYGYRNEDLVGSAIQSKTAKGVVQRKDLFITSKLWNTFHKPELVEAALLQSLKNLETDYLDLYLIHWPTAFKEGSELYPVDSRGLFRASEVEYTDTWEAMEAVCQKGLTRTIGISNFNSLQIKKLLKSAKITPVVNQVECHPYFNQLLLRDFCSEENIAITAYSPLGSRDRPWQQPGEPDLINDPIVKALAEKRSKTPAQILIRFNIQLSNIVIPKSASKKRLLENISVFDFELSDKEMDVLYDLDRNIRLCRFAGARGHRNYPFKPEIDF